LSLTQQFSGRAQYYADRPLNQHLLFVAIACLVGSQPLDALVDTAAQWCMLPETVAGGIEYAVSDEESDARVHTRFGTVAGRLVRIPTRLRAQEGRDLEIEATWFISDEWLGPPVIGWKGCLERLRFALDPSDESFYFAEL
jgi:hypothetical protein